MKRTMPLLIVLLATVPPFFLSSLPHRPQPVSGFDTYLEVQSLVYSDSPDHDRIERLLETTERQFTRARPEALRDYWLARLHLLAAGWYNWIDENRAALRELDKVFDRIERSLESGEYSDGQRVLADAHSQMGMARGFVYMIRNGEEAKRATLSALELDPDNIHANITAAGYFLNAPPFAGGDVSRGIELLERALALETESESDRFLVLTWLSQGYARENRMEQAREYWNRAYEIYPGSNLLQMIAEEYDLSPG